MEPLLGIKLQTKHKLFLKCQAHERSPVINTQTDLYHLHVKQPSAVDVHALATL
jgi:hypothetical protein